MFYRSWKYLMLSFLYLIMCACNDSIQVGKIDLEKSEQIIKYIDQLKITELVLNEQNLIINDTLVLINPDSLKKPIFHEYRMSLEEWELRKKQPKEKLRKLLSLMNESSNKRMIKENEAYFFSEGGWIDSDFGKVYSKQQLKNRVQKFKFDRILEIKALNERDNWYVYYAD